jgi:hypothetical protein
VSEPTSGSVPAVCSIHVGARRTASVSVNASMAPIATRSMNPLTWRTLLWTTRTTKLARHTGHLLDPSYTGGRARPVYGA